MTERILTELQEALNHLQNEAKLTNDHILVIGCSTSEVIGKKIGTAGTEHVAKTIYEGLTAFSQQTGVNLAFQCCEHLNRALVVERKLALQRQLEIVSVIPVKEAGGALAAFAYAHLNDPVVVEFIKADAGIDIGDTFIGMHLKHVAVPVRGKVKQIGEAHITMAKTRPKLIGGARAVYNNSRDNITCS